MTKEQVSLKKRYKSIRSHKGIRKDLESGSYLVTKSIKGKRFFRVFSKLSDAVDWKNTFHPAIASRDVQGFQKIPTSNELNGKDKGFSFRDIWNLYVKNHLKCAAFSTQEVSLERSRFYDGLMELKLVELTPEFFDHYIETKKDFAILSNSKRFNFNDDLKRLKALLNWYRENYDFTFQIPILKRHKSAGVIKLKPEKKKKLNPDQITSFFSNLDQVWKQLAICQFYLGARVSEVAGLLSSNVDFKNRSIEIKNVAIWERKTKKFRELKELPKNGEVRFCHMNDTLFKVLLERENQRPPNCDFLFQIDGQPIQYRQVQYHFDKALRKAGLYPEYSGTHFLRHSMATITRRVTKSLEATQAVTGHKDQRLVQHYASLPSEAQKTAVCEVEAFMKGIRLDQQEAKLNLVK